MGRRATLLVALSLAAGAAQACGYCVEDKVAAVYDHAVVTRAFGERHHVAFFHMDGAPAPDTAARRRLEALAASAKGVDRGSVRISLEAQMLSVAFDPRRAPFGALHKALEKQLSAGKISLMPLQVMEQPAALKTVAR